MFPVPSEGAPVRGRGVFGARMCGDWSRNSGADCCRDARLLIMSILFSVFHQRFSRRKGHGMNMLQTTKARFTANGPSRVRAATVFMAGATVLLLIAGCVDNRLLSDCRTEGGRYVDYQRCMKTRQDIRSEKASDERYRRREEDRASLEKYQQEQARKRAAAAARISPRERAAREKRIAARNAARQKKLKGEHAVALRVIAARWRREQARPHYRTTLRKYPRISWLSGVWCAVPSGRPHRHEILVTGRLVRLDSSGYRKKIEKKYYAVQYRAGLYMLISKYPSYSELAVRKISKNQYKVEWTNVFSGPEKKGKGRKTQYSDKYQRCDRG